MRCTLNGFWHTVELFKVKAKNMFHDIIHYYHSSLSSFLEVIASLEVKFLLTHTLSHSLTHFFTFDHLIFVILAYIPEKKLRKLEKWPKKT